MDLDSYRGLLEQVEDVKVEIQTHFQHRFEEPNARRPELEGVYFMQLSLPEKCKIEERFTFKELKDALWNCDGEKIPCPYGYNMGFYKKCWKVIKGELFDCINKFYTKVILPKAIVASFLSLIPKI